MKKLIKLGIVIALAGLLLSSGYIYDAIFGEGDGTEYVSENVHFIEIDNAVIAIEKTKWSVDEYKEIQSMISTKTSNSLLDENESIILQEGLDRTYIPKLIQATKTFFNGPCDDRGQLMVLHRELKRYHSGSVEQEYKKNVEEYKAATSNLYSLAGYDPVGGGRRGGYDGEIERYIKLSFDKQKTNTYIKELERLSNTMYVNNCKLGKESYARNIKRLDDHFFKAIERDINRYIESRGFAKPQTEEYFVKLLEYKRANIRNNANVLNTRIAQIAAKLDAHYYKNVKGQIDRYSKGSNHTESETDKFAAIIEEYVDLKDQSLRNVKEVIRKSDDLFYVLDNIK